MNYNNYTFRYPKLTRAAKGATDQITFTDCDFSAVDKIKLSGFVTVNFNGYMTELRKPTTIEIENCGNVMFTNIYFKDDQTTLIINDANIVYFEHLSKTKGMNLQTQNCGIIRYESSPLNFDTSQMNAKKFELVNSKVSRQTKLNLTGITESLQIYKTYMPRIKEDYRIRVAQRTLRPIARFQEPKER